MSNLPKDGASVRLHKLYHLVEYCARYGMTGCTTSQLMKEGQQLGNRTDRVLEYITLLVTWGLITRNAERYYVNELNYREWAEAQGFIERVYLFKCQNTFCTASYPSKLMTCPECGTQNPLKTNEPMGGHTYTLPNSQKTPENDKPIEKATDLDTYTHEDTPRQIRAQKGKDNEKRAVKFLSQFGEAGLGGGQNGRPDVLFTSGRAGYAVEVKSVEHQVRVKGGFKSGSVPLTVNQWRGLCGFADGEGLVPLLLVMVHVRGSDKGPLYHFVSREAVDSRVTGFSGKNLRVSVLDLAAMSVQTIREGVPVIGGFRL